MKGINRFFYRLDQIKKILLIICIPAAIACWFFPVGFLALLTVGPLSHIGIVIGLFPFHIPSDTEITKEVQECHKNYHSQVARECKLQEDSISVLEGFSSEKAYLRRRMGSRIIYPVCRTVAFAEKEEQLSLYTKDTPLLPGENVREIKWLITKSAPVKVALEKQKNNLIVVTFTQDEEKMIVFAQDQYKTKELLEKYRSYVTFEKETIKV